MCLEEEIEGKETRATQREMFTKVKSLSMVKYWQSGNQ